MSGSLELPTSAEILNLRDQVIERGRFPEAASDFSEPSHAAMYDDGSERLGILFWQDQEEGQYPWFEVIHAPLESNEEGVRVYRTSNFGFTYDYSLFRPKYFLLDFSEKLITLVNDERIDQPLPEYELYRTRAGRKLLKQRQRETASLHRQFGETGFTRAKYNDMVAALGRCTLDSLEAVSYDAIELWKQWT